MTKILGRVSSLFDSACDVTDKLINDAATTPAQSFGTLKRGLKKDNGLTPLLRLLSIIELPSTDDYLFLFALTLTEKQTRTSP
jgi:hypothetical protein